MNSSLHLRPHYDLELPSSLEEDSGAHGIVFRRIQPGTSVLDIGCDTGRFGEVLRRTKRCRVDGIEPDTSAASIAATRLDRVSSRSIENEWSFDGLIGYEAVLFLDVLEHLADPWAVLRGAYGSLRAGGAVHVVAPNVAHISVVRRLLRGEFDYKDRGTMDRTHLRWFTRRSLARSLEQASFVDVMVDTVTVLPWLGDTRIGHAVAPVLGRAFPDLLGGSLVAFGRRAA